MVRTVHTLSATVFLLLGLVQLVLIYGASSSRLDALLAGWSFLFLPVACLCWALVLTGLAAQLLLTPGEPSSRAGRLACTLLNPLIGRSGPVSAAPQRIDGAALARALKSKLAGQDAICEELAAQIRIRAASAIPSRPVAILLFTGPPGSGKTYLGQCLASALRRHLIHVDMAQFSEPFAATRLFGAPPGYVGSDRAGSLAAGLRLHPNAVILLDEIEKAHPDLFRRFLVAWNDGAFTDTATGQTVSCRQAIFVMTSNAALDPLADVARAHPDDPVAQRRGATRVLTGRPFPPEMLDRIDRIWIFRPLPPAVFGTLAAREAVKLLRAHRLEPAGAIDPALFDRLLGDGPTGSAREIIRAVELALSEQLIAAREAGARSVRLERQPDGIAVIPA